MARIRIERYPQKVQARAMLSSIPIKRKGQPQPHRLFPFPDLANMAAEMPMRSSSSSKIQELYDACRIVFAAEEGPFPSLDAIQWLRALLGEIEAVDVGIDGSSDYEEHPSDMISGRRVEEITYVHIHQCDDFSIGVFCFPAGATMPLHDHPEMVVLSKVLYGSLKARAYDWVVPPHQDSFRKRGLASLVVDDAILGRSSPASVLFPSSGGNMHTFTALTPCAILDVLSPPYSDDEGRPSTYFSETPIPCLNGFAVLEERVVQVPEDLMVVGAQYVGPELVVDDDDVDEDGDQLVDVR